jgi:hypothetical protein
MKINTRRSFFGMIAAMTSLVTGAMKLSGQQTPSVAPTPGTTPASGDTTRRSGTGNHIHDGIFYFSVRVPTTAIPKTITLS